MCCFDPIQLLLGVTALVVQSARKNIILDARRCLSIRDYSTGLGVLSRDSASSRRRLRGLEGTRLTAHETSPSTDSIEALVVELSRWEKRTCDAKKRSSLLCATLGAWLSSVDVPSGGAWW